jgi:hypothetical protein
MAILLGGLVVFALVIVWGQARAVRTEAGTALNSPLYGERLARATLGGQPPTPTRAGLKRPTYLETCWDFFAYESYAFGWFLSTQYQGNLTNAQIEKLCNLFRSTLKLTYPNSNRLYRSMLLTKYPEAIQAVQQPTSSADDIMRSAPFSKPLIVFGSTFAEPANYKVFTTSFMKSYGKLPKSSRPLPVSQVTSILSQFGKYIGTTEDCVTINTAGARPEGAKVAQSCALVCVTGQAQMSCGVCIVTLGVNVGSCAQVTCGAGAITCGSGVETCGGTCKNAMTCLAASCSNVSCNVGTCSGGETCGAANTCSGHTCVAAGGGACK